MTILYADDFESYDDFAVPSGWVNSTGEAGWKVRDVAAYAVSGTKSMLAVGMVDNYYCVYKGIAARQSADYVIKQKAKFKTSELLLQRVLHAEAGGGFLGSSAYRVLFTSTASSVTASLKRWDGNEFTAELATGNRNWSVSADDIINTRLLVDGLNVSVWVWNASNESMPASAMMTFTDSTQRGAGYLAIELNNGANTTLAGFDDVTISDVSTGADATATTTLPSLTLSAPIASATGTSSAQNGSATATFAAIALFAPTATAAGTSASAGTITTPVLKNNTGTVLASQTGITAHIYAISSGDKVITLTGQTTNGSGVMTLSDVLIVAGTQYRVVIVLGSGAEGMEKLTAS